MLDHIFCEVIATFFSFIFFIVTYCLSCEEIKAVYNYLYFIYILSFQVLRRDGIDFAEATEKDRAPSFEFIFMCF